MIQICLIFKEVSKAHLYRFNETILFNLKVEFLFQKQSHVFVKKISDWPVINFFNYFIHPGEKKKKKPVIYKALM